MSDRRPLAFQGRYLWHPQPDDAPTEHQYDYLPREVYARLTGYIQRGGNVSRIVKSYPTEAAAMAALRRAEATAAVRQV